MDLPVCWNTKSFRLALLSVTLANENILQSKLAPNNHNIHPCRTALHASMAQFGFSDRTDFVVSSKVVTIGIWPHMSSFCNTRRSRNEVRQKQTQSLSQPLDNMVSQYPLWDSSYRLCSTRPPAALPSCDWDLSPFWHRLCLLASVGTGWNDDDDDVGGGDCATRFTDGFLQAVSRKEKEIKALR